MGFINKTQLVIYIYLLGRNIFIHSFFLLFFHLFIYQSFLEYLLQAWLCVKGRGYRQSLIRCGFCPPGASTAMECIHLFKMFC